jgi:LAO/AO transport system kinase
MLEIGAGLMSGADPRPGAEGEVGHRPSGRPRSEEALAPILKTVAASGEGLGELVAVLDAHLERAKASGELQARRRRGAIAEARTLLSERVLGELEALEGGLEAELADEIVRGDLEATEAADILFESIRRGAGNEGA